MFYACVGQEWVCVLLMNASEADWVKRPALPQRQSTADATPQKCHLSIQNNLSPRSPPDWLWDFSFWQKSHWTAIFKTPVFCKFHWSSNSSMNCLKIIWKSALNLFFFFFAYSTFTQKACSKGTFLELIPLWLWFYCSLTSHLACQIRQSSFHFIYCSSPTFIPPVVCDICVFVPFQERMGKQKWNRKCWRLNKESVYSGGYNPVFIVQDTLNRGLNVLFSRAL